MRSILTVAMLVMMAAPQAHATKWVMRTTADAQIYIMESVDGVQVRVIGSPKVGKGFVSKGWIAINGVPVREFPGAPIDEIFGIDEEIVPLKIRDLKAKSTRIIREDPTTFELFFEVKEPNGKTRKDYGTAAQTVILGPKVEAPPVPPAQPPVEPKASAMTEEMVLKVIAELKAEQVHLNEAAGKPATDSKELDELKKQHAAALELIRKLQDQVNELGKKLDKPAPPIISTPTTKSLALKVMVDDQPVSNGAVVELTKLVRLRIDGPEGTIRVVRLLTKVGIEKPITDDGFDGRSLIFPVQPKSARTDPAKPCLGAGSYKLLFKVFASDGNALGEFTLNLEVK